MKGRNLGNPHPLDSFTKGNTTLGLGVRTVLAFVGRSAEFDLLPAPRRTQFSDDFLSKVVGVRDPLTFPASVFATFRGRFAPKRDRMRRKSIL
jgi:hypothetical protein